MHKSKSVSRQGTFDTGPAQLDHRGSIRRGDIELPIVDEPSVRQNSTSVSHNDSGVYSQSPASKERSSSLVESRELPEKAGDEESPRYVDHNKLFPEDPKDRWEDRESFVNGASDGSGSLGTPKRKAIRDGDGGGSVFPHKAERGLKAEGSHKGVKTPRHKPHDYERTSLNHDRSNKTESGRGEKDPKSGSKPPDQAQEVGLTTPANSISHPDSTKPTACDVKDKDQQAAKSTALAKLKAKGGPIENSPNSTAGNQPKSAPDAAKEQHSPRERQNGLQQHQIKPAPQQQQEKQQQQQQNKHISITVENKLSKSQPKENNDSTTKVLSSNAVRSAGLIQTQHQQQQQQQQQKQQEPITDKDADTDHRSPRSKDKDENKDTTLTSGTAPSAVPKNLHQAFLEQTPLVQPNPFLLSTHEGSAPPQGQLQKSPNSEGSNSSSKTADVSKETKDSKGTTLSGQKAGVIATEKSSSGNDSTESSSNTDNSKSKSQSQSTMSTMAEGPRRGGGDSLSEVTLERDQLLRNEKTYQQRILQLEEEVKSAVKQSQELSSENRQLRNRVEAFETKAYGGSLEVKELRREKQDLVAMVAKLTGEKQQVEFDNERLKSKLSEMDSKTKQWDALYVENNKLKTKQAELEKRIQDLEKEKQGLQNSVKTVESAQMDKMAAVQNENKKLQAELINLQTKNSSLERKVERLEAENKELAGRMEQKKTELDELMRAMKTETNVEMELKEANTELEFAKNKIADYKKELDEVNHRYEVLEKEKDSAKSALRLKESEMKSVKANLEDKDTQVTELKRQVDAAKRNVKRLEDDLEDTKQVEKDSVNMKARIRSLKNEIEDSLAANHKLKQERTEARLETDRLNRDLATMSENMSEARRYIKKLESERGSRDKVEEELKARKQREQELERQLYDLNVRNEQLRKRVRELEEDKEELMKNRGGLLEVDLVNKKLQEDNKKLRQMVVERNMELAQRQSERNALVNRVDMLERKQNDSDIKVQQLKGWVDNVHSYAAVPHHEPNQHAVVALPPVPSQAVPNLPKAAGGGGRARRKKGQQQRQQHELNRSWEDLKLLKTEQADSLRTTPSLPAVLDSKMVQASVPAHGGYYDMYKSKMKLIRERKW